MATLTIKNLPDSLYERLKLTAANHRRSINNEAIVRLERSLYTPETNTAELLAEIRKSRDELAKKGVYLTEEILRQGKEEGRP